MKEESEKPVYEVKVVPDITVTSYTSLERLTDSTPNITATGKECSLETIALSRELISRYHASAPYDYGDEVFILLGPYNIEDTTNKRFNRRADIWLSSLDESLVFGLHKNATIFSIEGEV